ncbi:hypothetical protein F5B22DRAFT_145435 [Xylaria bambusicola]|uniref:uncharacterized protein n=1 Tax=Xylaria bambusicola TaxID=326684 RepID=UPI0020081549|nr:uncharacterized protein F5B22DRAFT_145435 [Xylaria bambusicola]KAI0517061.1 hypothetical protein F5B22DRAFT_145435 [Xylaria bambusicola]
MTVAGSAAAQFASIEELLLILAHHVNDHGTLWSLCLSSWRFNCVFTPKLFEHIIVRAEEDDDGTGIQHTVDGLLAGPYLHDLRHLHLIMGNGPDYPKTILDMVKELLSHTPLLKIFTWDSEHGEIPVSMLVHLSKQCAQLEELHLSSGVTENHFRYGLRNVPDKPVFENIRIFTCSSIATWHAFYILNQCPNVEIVEMTHMEHMLALGWMHGGNYHGHLKALIVREEFIRARSGRPLKMIMCYSRIARVLYGCEVCDSPGMNTYELHNDKYTEVWPWAAGRARQFLYPGQVRHITYEYPYPEPSEMDIPSLTIRTIY